MSLSFADNPPEGVKQNSGNQYFSGYGFEIFHLLLHIIGGKTGLGH
jgi:hypothetical protein